MGNEQQSPWLHFVHELFAAETWKANSKEKLSQRVKNGMGLPKYKPVVYEDLQAMVHAKRLSFEHAESKVQKAVRSVQERRENYLLHQHRQLWASEFYKLARARERADTDFRSFLVRSSQEEEGDGHFLSELLDYELCLEHEREVFQLATVVPVCQLREDLLYRLTSGPPTANQHAEWVHVLQQVVFVKEQQQVVMDSLQEECFTLQQEISADGQEARLASAELAECVAALVQLPDEVLTADYPSTELQDCVSSAFNSLSHKYTERLEEVHGRLLDLDRNCGWCEEDHLRFVHTVGQYSPELRHHRAMCADMLRRVLLQHSPAAQRDHERNWDCYRYRVAQERLLLERWCSEREALRLRALGTLEEARAKQQEQQALHRDRCHQQHVCSQLRLKLQQWREQQEEVSRLEASLAARWQEEESLKQREEQEREQVRRTREKERLREFYAELGRRREECGRRKEARLAELRGEMEEQARRDRERVQYRETLLKLRKQEQETKEKLRQRDEDERKERLKILCNQVAVVADADPERMMGQTEAWRTRLQPDKEQFILHRPLFDLYTYTDKQIVADPRVRIEQALRTAGMHHTAYARLLLSAVQPPKPPRRDTESTAFSS